MMIQKKKNVLAFMAVFSCMSMQATPMLSDVTNFVTGHKDKALMATVFGLLARPAYNLVQQWIEQSDCNPYTLLSLLGYKCSVKPETNEFAEQFRAQVSVGSADVTVKTPTHIAQKVEKALKELMNLPEHVMAPKKSAQEFFSMLNNFYPKLMVAIEDQTSPVVRDKEAGVDSTVKRLFAKFSCGQFEARTGMDVSEAMMIPASIIGSCVLYQLSQYLNKLKA